MKKPSAFYWKAILSPALATELGCDPRCNRPKFKQAKRWVEDKLGDRTYQVSSNGCNFTDENDAPLARIVHTNRP